MSEPADQPNVLPLVSITRAGYDAYQEFARQAAEAFAESGKPLDPTTIPEERGYIDAEGYLVVYLDLPTGRLAARLPPIAWAWNDRN